MGSNWITSLPESVGGEGDSEAIDGTVVVLRGRLRAKVNLFQLLHKFLRSSGSRLARLQRERMLGLAIGSKGRIPTAGSGNFYRDLRMLSTCRPAITVPFPPRWFH